MSAVDDDARLSTQRCRDAKTQGAKSGLQLRGSAPCIQDLVPRVALRDRQDRWWYDVKASDDFLDRLFEMYFAKLGLPNLMRKSDYHVLASLVPEELLADEIREKLDMVLRVAQSARPLKEQE